MFVSSVLTTLVLSAGPTSTPDVVDSLQYLLAGEKRVRLVCESGIRDLDRPLLDAAGLRSGTWEHPRRPGIFVVVGGRREPVRATIPWSEIREIQVGGGHAGRGALAGALGGLAVGTLVAIGLATDANDYADVAAPIAVFSAFTLAGPILGAIIGDRLGWRTVYRDGRLVHPPRADGPPNDPPYAPERPR